MRTIHTHALLLRKVLLANDDAILDLFTAEGGRRSVFVKGLGKSKKKAIELDYLRLLDVTMAEGRSKKLSLRSVRAEYIFQGFGGSLTLLKQGFYWLERLRDCIAEDYHAGDMFEEVCRIFARVTPETIAPWDVCLRLKILRHQGLLPSRPEYLTPENIAITPVPELRSALLTMHSEELLTLQKYVESLEKTLQGEHILFTIK